MTALRERRLAVAMPMAKLAHQAQVSYSLLSRYEMGWALPTRQTAERLAASLATTVEQLFPGAALKDRGGAA